MPNSLWCCNNSFRIYINALSKDVEIIASRDTTITGSRCQHAPIFLWYALKKRGLIGLQDEVQKCIMKARYLQNRLGDAGIGTILNKFSNIVIFERPLDHDFTRTMLEFGMQWEYCTCDGDATHYR